MSANPDQWQPIATAPLDRVIIRGWWVEFSGCGRSWEVDIEYHDGSDEFVSHWMPYPDPPKQCGAA